MSVAATRPAPPAAVLPAAVPSAPRRPAVATSPEPPAPGAERRTAADGRRAALLASALHLGALVLVLVVAARLIGPV